MGRGGPGRRRRSAGGGSRTRGHHSAGSRAAPARRIVAAPRRSLWSGRGRSRAVHERLGVRASARGSVEPEHHALPSPDSRGRGRAPSRPPTAAIPVPARCTNLEASRSRCGPAFTDPASRPFTPKPTSHDGAAPSDSRFPESDYARSEGTGRICAELSVVLAKASSLLERSLLHVGTLIELAYHRRKGRISAATPARSTSPAATAVAEAANSYSPVSYSFALAAFSSSR